MKNPKRALKKILVVEDESVIQTLVQRAIDPMKCRVISVGSIQEGKEQIDQADFDLLVADLRLPDGSGVETIRHFKTRCPGASVIIITGSLTPEERLKQVEDLKISDCIFKPFELQVLRKAVHAALWREPMPDSASLP